MGLQDFSRIFIKEDPFQVLEEDVDEVIEALREIEPVMVVFDTANDYLERATDTDKGLGVVQALQPFKRIAKECNCAVVLVRHLTKDSKQKALYRGQGNMSFVGKARIVIAVAKDPNDEDTSQMAVSKLNNAKRPKALTFHVEDLSTVHKLGAFRFSWGRQVYATADEILSAPVERGRPDNERQEAKEFLEAQLSGGRERTKKELQTDMERRNMTFSVRSLERAADDLGVRKRGGPGSRWKLPT